MEIYARADHLNEGKEVLWKNELENFFGWLDHSFFVLCTVVCIAYCILLNDTAVSVSSLSSWRILTRWRIRVGDVNTIPRKETRTPVVLFASCSPHCFPLLVHVRTRKKSWSNGGDTLRVLDPNVTSIHVRFCTERRAHRIDSSQTAFAVPIFPHGVLVLRCEFARVRFSLHVRLSIRKVFSKRASSRGGWVLVALLSTLAANN